MVQGDEAWWRLARTIADEDRDAVLAYNARTLPEQRLAIAHSPVPCLGAMMTAPVVLLLAQPPLGAGSSPDDQAFRRTGWPISSLHPDAPSTLAECWHKRVSALVDAFGAQHVSNSLAVVYLTPWRGATFDPRLRLPSRRRMLALAATAAARDAIVLMMQGEMLWTEDAELAALPATRCLHPRYWREAELSPRNFGEAAWALVHKRIGIHAWL
jgi:hypothetical protein